MAATSGLKKNFSGKGRKMILHRSMSSYGCFSVIDKWHQRKYSPIAIGNTNIYCGYHFIICNGILYEESEYLEVCDGLLEMGRHLNFPGKCKGLENIKDGEKAFQVCLIGNTDENLTEGQVFRLRELCGALRPSFIVQHSDFARDTNGYCAGLDDDFMQFMNERIKASYKF